MARRARAELSRIFARIIQARRQSQGGEEDILQCFIDSRYEKVCRLSSNSYTLSSLSFAGFTCSAIAHALCQQDCRQVC